MKSRIGLATVPLANLPPAPADVQRAYVPVTQVAAYLGTCRATVYNLMNKGEIPFAKFGRSRRIAWRDVLAYAEKCTVSQTV